ncbi:MAG: glycosyltransferase family 4 protein [Candidatus Aenigmatarchaeota archaeon]|nr:MAG: glycosyltransferase family 4 protein [Candidatus Aenigmarchaeota archaeon]
MRIVMTGYTTPNSGVTGMGLGISKYTYNVARELVGMGHDVTLYVRADYEPKEDWIKTVKTPTKVWLAYPTFLQKAVAHERADVFHGDYIHTGMALLKANKHPLVVTVHDVIPFIEPHPLKDAFYVWLHKRRHMILQREAEALIVQTGYMKKKTVETTRADPSKVFYAFSGVDLDYYYPKTIAKKKGIIKIGYLGGIDGRKNAVLLVRAFALLSKKYKNIELHIGGSGRTLDALKALGVERAYFHGRIPQGKENDFLNALDIFVFPSLQEGFGLMQIEAMAAGLPVVGTTACTSPELVDGAGLMAEPTPEDVAAKVETLVNDETLRKSLGRKGRERARLFSWRKIAEGTLEIYKTVIERYASTT